MGGFWQTVYIFHMLDSK